MKIFRFLMVLALLFSGACSMFPADRGNITQSTPTPTSPAPTPTRILPPENLTPQSGPVTLRIWLPAEFDPDSGSLAGNLLQARLDEFATSRPRVRLEVRVKSLQDPGGLLEALSTASGAAPLALPDLVALPRAMMEAAALKGLLQPLDGATALAEPEWYEYALQLGKLQNSTFGLPFAGDALLLLYRPELLEKPPISLLESLDLPGPLVFAAADPQALYTLNLYRAAGGSILDQQGRPTLEPEILESILTLFLESERADLMPLWLTQVENDQQAWEAYQAGRSTMVVTWASRYLTTPGIDSAAAPVPTLNGTPYSLATGWVWSLASHAPEKQALAVELAEFLTEKEFLGQWTAAAGYLPPRSDSLSSWNQGPARNLAAELVLNMNIIPSSDILSTLAPTLHQAVIQILKQQGTPHTLAVEAVERLNNP